jgi:hypothetical protein
MEYIQHGSFCVGGKQMSGSVTVSGKGAGATMVAGDAGPMAVEDAATGAGAFWECAIGAFIITAQDAE